MIKLQDDESLLNHVTFDLRRKGLITINHFLPKEDGILSFLNRFKFLFGLAAVLFLISFSLIVILPDKKQDQVLGARTTQQPVTIIDNGVENNYLANGASVEEILSNLNIQAFPEDKITVFMSPSLGIGTLIKIRRATIINVNDSGKITTYRTWQETVKEFLDEKGITLSDVDKISPGLNTTLLNNMNIKIVRVRIENSIEREIIPFQTIHQNDPTMYYGKTKIGQNGINGIKEVNYKIVYENGRIAKKERLSEKIITSPINKIILDGSKPFSTQNGLASWTRGVTASRRYPKGTKLKITNLANGKSVIAIVGGWGPQEWTERILDLNFEYFSQIASLNQGEIRVLIEEIG